MNKIDKKILADLVRDHHIHDLLDVLQEAIEDHVDELVDLNRGSSFIKVKEMDRVAHHLSIFSRG